MEVGRNDKRKKRKQARCRRRSSRKASKASMQAEMYVSKLVMKGVSNVCVFFFTAGEIRSKIVEEENASLSIRIEKKNIYIAVI